MSGLSLADRPAELDIVGDVCLVNISLSPYWSDEGFSAKVNSGIKAACVWTLDEKGIARPGNIDEAPRRKVVSLAFVQKCVASVRVAVSEEMAEDIVAQLVSAMVRLSPEKRETLSNRFMSAVKSALDHPEFVA